MCDVSRKVKISNILISETKIVEKHNAADLHTFIINDCPIKSMVEKMIVYRQLVETNK